MSTSYFTFGGAASDIARDQAVSLGLACSVMRHSPLHVEHPVKYLYSVIEPALRHNYVKFYYSLNGDVVAYVAWAFLAPDVEQKFMREGRWALHESEWNEGESAWIVDLVAPYGHVREVLRDLRDTVFAGQQRLRYFRAKRGRAICKEVSRDSHCYFLRQPVAATV